MKKSAIILLAVVLLVGILFFVFKKEAKITNFPSSGKTIVAFGDSLVAGVGATNDNNFPSLLSKKIGEPIINLGVPGNTSADGLARIDQVTKQNPKIVLVLLGGNDVLRRVPSEETFQNIDNIVAQIQEGGAVVILLGVRGGLLSDTYEKHFEEIAEDRGALYVPDVLDGIFGKATLMDDSIHPNDRGYALIAEKILPVLEKALGN